ncbi:MAG: YoaK family protein [Polyangiaceae bacterium]
MSFLATDSKIFAPRFATGWVAFALAAGFVNAAAVMACKNFVTHVTGNITNIAVDSDFAGKFILVVTSFIVGAMIAVLVAETMKARARVAFTLSISLVSLTLVAVGVLGRGGFFGPFGISDEVNTRAFVMLGLLAASMGMLNAAVANVTNNQIRVTHMTGPATDLAGNLVRAALGGGRGPAVEFKWAMLRLAKFVGFVAGAALATAVSGALQFDIFSAAAAILFVALGLTAAPEGAPSAEAPGTKSTAPDANPAPRHGPDLSRDSNAAE